MTAYNGLRKLTNIVLLVPVCLSLGCANLVETLSASGAYHFRRARWGYTQEMVLASEQGKRLHLKKGNTLVYNHRIGDTPLKIVYTFKDNRLRAAGYLTDQPVIGADKIIEQSVQELGEPTKVLNDGMIWLDDETLVYSNAYVSRVSRRSSEYKFSGGVLEDVLEPRETPGTQKRWDGVWAYIDQDFYREMHEVNVPLDQMSFYEKLLFGVIKRRSIYTYYSGARGLSTSPGSGPISIPE